MSERLGGGHGETRHDPEVTDLLNFLETWDKIQATLGWLVESGANAPLLRSVKRAQLQRLMQQLGIDTTNPDDPGGYGQLADLRAGITDRSQRPKPRVEIPDTSFFAQRIEAVSADFQRFGVPYNPVRPFTDEVSLSDVIQYGHTDWSEVQARTGHLPTEIRGIAHVMADPIAYHSWAYGSQGRPADHITIGEDWSIQNGRHRSLAALCLGEDYILDSGMSQWIPVEVEQAL